MSSLWKRTTLAMFASCVVCTLFGGCEVKEKDVADARDQVVKEQQETAEALKSGEQDVQEAKKDLAIARHEAMRVPYEGGKDDQVLEKERELADAKQNMQENVNEEKKETAEAKQEAKQKEAELMATKERDAFLVTANSKLAAVDDQLEAMEAEKDQLQDEKAKQQLQTEIGILEVKRESLSDAIDQVETVEVLQWQSKKSLVDDAIAKLNEVESPQD